MSDCPFKYPIVCISGPSVEIMRDSKRFGRCTTAALRGGVYSKMVVIDAGGYRYDICGAHRIRYPGPFWGFRWMRRIVEIEPVIKSEPVKITLSEICQLICAAISKAPWFYASATGNHEDIRKQVCDCASIKEIMALSFFQSGPLG